MVCDYKQYVGDRSLIYMCGGVGMLSKFKSFFAVLLGVVTLISVASPSFAALDLSQVQIDTTPVFTLAGIIISAIASIWAIKKVIKLGNRS